LPAEERHHHQRRHWPVHHQQPRHLHPSGEPHALAWGPPLPSPPANLVDPVKETAAGRRKQATSSVSPPARRVWRHRCGWVPPARGSPR
jgi:hypothetical protein